MTVSPRAHLGVCFGNIKTCKGAGFRDLAVPHLLLKRFVPVVRTLDRSTTSISTWTGLQLNDLQSPVQIIGKH